jgi:hypothetical protein
LKYYRLVIAKNPARLDKFSEDVKGSIIKSYQKDEAFRGHRELLNSKGLVRKLTREQILDKQCLDGKFVKWKSTEVAGISSTVPLDSPAYLMKPFVPQFSLFGQQSLDQVPIIRRPGTFRKETSHCGRQSWILVRLANAI